MEPHCDPILLNLIQLLAKDFRSLEENAAVALGRLGKACPLLVAPHLSKFINNWCISLCKVRVAFEKQTAFEGLCDLIMVNARGITEVDI